MLCHPPCLNQAISFVCRRLVGVGPVHVAVDSGCCIHTNNDPSVFARLQSSTARVRIADGRSKAMVGEGPVALQTYNASSAGVVCFSLCVI